MKKKVDWKHSRELYTITGILLGIFWFGVWWGFSCLDITNTAWMKEGDSATHYFGWVFYKLSEWNFPIGLIDGLVYPDKISVIYTDSIPLFAFIFKLLSPFLPDFFQYFGLWGLFCLICTGTITSWIVYHYKGNLLCNIVMTSFVISQPCMIGRMFTHSALAGQWIILLAYYTWIKAGSLDNYKKKSIAWSIVMFFACTIHMYFIPMVAVIMMGACMDQVIVKGQKFWKELSVFFISCITGVLTLALFGAFGGGISTASELGYYCLNLNTFINPGDYSTILSSLPHAIAGQYEGFCYLGVGLLLLVLCCIVGCFLENRIKFVKSYFAQGFVVCTFLILGMGTVCSFNNTIFFRWSYPRVIHLFLGIFRSSGRFIWPIGYGIIIKVIKYISNSKFRNLKLCVCFLCLGIQIFDFSGKIRALHNSFAERVQCEYTGLHDPIWDRLAQMGYEHIYYDGDVYTTIKLAEFASKNNMTINDFFASRKNNRAIDNNKKDVAEKLKNGYIEANTIYVSEMYPMISSGLHVYFADELFIVTAQQIEGYNEYENVLVQTETFNQYWNLLGDTENCIIFITCRDECSAGLDDKNVAAMNKLGLQDLRNHFRESYIAIIDNGSVVEERLESDAISLTYFYQDTEFYLSSGGGAEGIYQSILVNGKEVSKCSRGLNIVVWDKQTNEMMDSVAFDTFEDATMCR